MSREIKFRVWNEELEEMYKLTKVNYLGTTGITDPYVGGDKSIWMQYTGLKDKNGVKIYERDIVNITRKSHMGIGGFGKMFYEEMKTTKTVEFSQENAYGLDFQHCDYEVIVEIIGNAYENPELLEASK